MSQLGRISGQLLKDNLTRNGHDLTFDNDLLHLDVTNRRIGVKTTTPEHELDVAGTTQTTDLEVRNTATLADIEISTDTITSLTGTLNLTNPSGDQVTYQSKLSVDDITLENNVISTNTLNTNLVLDPNGSGEVDIYGNTNVYGDVYVTGDIRADGNITVGNANTDTIEFKADIASNIIPDLNDTYTLGNVDYRWKDLWVKNIYADAIDTGDIVVDGITLNLTQGKIYYVATNGSDTNAGQHQNDPFASIEQALSVATADDTVYIYPGTYTEVFPLLVPVGVTVKGAGIRSVKIVPTVGTNTQDAFLLNGETTIEDVTIADFYQPGYAFRFATGITVTSRSPYIRNITVLTKGSVTSISDPLGYDEGDAGGGALIDGSVANIASKEASMLFHSVTFICPSADVIVATNGARVEWLNSFTYYANRSMHLYSSSAGFAGDGKTRVKITNTTGTWSVGNTLSYYDTDGTTVLASGVIESIDGDFYNIDGRVLGFEQIQDRASKTITVHGDAKLSTAVKKFGTASLALDGTGDYLSVPPQADFNFGTDNFTIECWIYPTAVPTAGQYAFVAGQSKAGVGNSSCGLYLGSAAGIIYLYSFGTFGTLPGAAVAINAWSHIALTREGNDFKLWINGVQAGSTLTYAGEMTSATTTNFTIGGNAGYNLYVTGYIDDVKVSKGVARYTTTFSVPTAQLTGDLSTVLLLTLNGANNSTAIADNGITLQDLRTSAGGTASIIDFADYSDFGVELRSIGSAAVYGNYGIYGDGPGVIAYLIGQNLAYIGNGAATTNDPNTVIQANEVVELNDAKIFYNSVDHKGDFRVGDLFYVNQATGEVSFTNSNVTIGTSLTFDNGLGDVTFLDATKIETGDFRISGNTVETLTQDFNVDSATNQINLQSNVTVTGNLDVTGDVTVGGNVTIGNESTDVVRFVAGVDSDILPALDSQYDLGTPTERWSTLYSTTLVNADIQISTNVITTTNSNLDLTLQANGSGRIYVPSNNVEITNNLTVNGTTDVQDLNVTGTLTHVGDVTQTGNVTQTGDITLTGTFTTTGYGQFADIKIDNNSISTTIGTNDLILDAAGTGRVYVPDSDVEITQDLTVDGYIDVGSLNVDTTISSLTLTAGDIKLESNFITTLTGNNNLELRANGTGLIYVPSNNVQIDNNLTVFGTTNLATTNIGVVGTPATVTHVGGVTQTGDLFQTGNTEITGTLTVGSTAQFEDINIDNNIITTTIGNNDLVLEAAGTGKVIVPVDDAEVTGTLTVVGTTSTTIINNTGTVTSGTFSTGTLRITTNNITTTVGNTDLVLEASGTGRIYIPSNDVTLGKTLTVTGLTTLVDTDITGTLTHVGATTRTGDVNQTGNYVLTGNLTVSNVAQFKDVNITNNVITTTLTNSNLQLGAAGTGIISIPTNNVTIDNDLTVTGTTFTANINNSGTVTAGTFSTGNITINGNTIQTTVSNSNLQLQAAGTGFIELEQFDVQENELRINSGTDMTIAPNGTGIVDVNSTQSIKLPVGATGDRPTPATGMIRFNTSLSRYEGYDGANWIRLDGVSDADGNTYITAELTPGANDNIIRFVVDGTQVADLNSTRLNVINVDVDSININNNTISTTTTDTDLIFAPNGTGALRVGNFAFRSNLITNTVNNSITIFNQTGDGYVKINSTGGFVIPVGETGQRPALFEVGMMRYNTTDQRVEIWDGALWVGAGQGAGGGVTSAEAQDIGIVSAIIFG
jgi:hypothetical protein